MSKYFFIGSLAVAAALAACGSPAVPEPQGGDGPGGGQTAAAPTGKLTGVIKFDGKAPEQKPIQMKADPLCPKDGGAKFEEVVVSDGGLENVMIYVSSDVSYSGDAGADMEITQQGCVYMPHAITLQVGQKVKIKNGDKTNHNVHSLSDKNAQINFAQSPGSEETRSFDMVEHSFKVKCDVHPWMGGFVGVFDHPYHGVSKKGGAFEIKLPPGDYEISARHEKYGVLPPVKVTIKEGDNKQDFTFKG